MTDQLSKIGETMSDPDAIRESNQDDAVHLYHQRYSGTPVTGKCLLAVMKFTVEGPFIKNGRLIDLDPGNGESTGWRSPRTRIIPRILHEFI